MTACKKWTLSILASGSFSLLSLGVLLLHPGVLYAHHTTTGQFTIYHNQPLDPDLLQRVGQARELVQPAGVFDKALHLEVCLNDGSWYPSLVQAVWSPAFAWSLYNKVVLNGEANAQTNRLTFRTYAWNLTSLMAHEMTHCYQLHHLGWRQSNPLARHPTWKWEGYAEYVARRPQSQQGLQQRMARLQHAAPDRWDVQLADSSYTSQEYFTYLVLTEYCLDVKHLTFEQLLRDTTSEATTRQQLQAWYQAKKASK
jgi:hypothetical protein